MTVPDAMKIKNSEHPWKHDHCFGQDQKKPGEARTLVVIALTVGMMVIEMAAGWAFGFLRVRGFSRSQFLIFFSENVFHNPDAHQVSILYLDESLQIF